MTTPEERRRQEARDWIAITCMKIAAVLVVMVATAAAFSEWVLP